MTNNSTEYFGNGTFNYALKYFIQLYTIYMDIKMDTIYHLFTLFQKIKLGILVLIYGKFLNNLCLKLCKKICKINLNLNFKIIYIDFESGAHQAITDMFGNIKIIRCRFHLRQSWWRKVRSNYYYIIIVFINYLYCI